MGDLYTLYINSLNTDYLYDDPIYTSDIRSSEVRRLYRILYDKTRPLLSRRDTNDLALKWMIWGKIYEQLYATEESYTAVDPVLPSDEYSINDAILEEFTSRGIPSDVLQEMSTELKRSLYRIENNYAGYNTSLNRDSPRRYRVTYGPSSEYVDPDVYQWLSDLYTGEDFQNDLYKVLSRYSSTRVYDTSSTVDDGLINLLISKGLNHDLMASPMTAIVNSYTGIYPDVDYKFGSMGKFTDVTAIDSDGLFMWLNGPDVPYTPLALQYTISWIQSEKELPLTLVAIVEPSSVDVPEDIVTFRSDTKNGREFLILQNDEGVDRWYFSESDINQLFQYI